jgi:hypothetical protein
MNTETALTIHRASTTLSAEQRADYWGQAKALISAGLFPEKFQTAEQAFMVALYGHEMGMSPQRAWKQIHLIKGQPALEVHLQVAKVREAIPTLIWKIIEHNDDRCVIEHGRSKDDLNKTEFTFAEAEAAGLTAPTKSGKPSNWLRHRKDMLYARAAGRAVRWFYPETQGGGLLHNVDEMRDALTDAPAPGRGIDEAKAGDGRMPKDATILDVKPEPVEQADPTPAAAPSDAPPAAPASKVDEAAVLALVGLLNATADANEIDRRYSEWRAQHHGKAETLIAGYDAKEQRLRALQQQA